MPKERRSRTVVHEPSVQLHKRTFTVQENAVEHVDIGAAVHTSGNDILTALVATDTRRDMLAKKGKKALKREAFLRKLGAVKTLYSKSHARRERRKVKEQLAGGGLNDIQAILSVIAVDENDTNEADASGSSPAMQEKDSSSTETDQPEVQAKQKATRIGESKTAPLTQTQRKRVLKMEQFRQPLIRSNPEYAKSPFAAIRTHAQNTLIKHQAPS